MNYSSVPSICSIEIYLSTEHYISNFMYFFYIHEKFFSLHLVNLERSMCVTMGFITYYAVYHSKTKYVFVYMKLIN